MEKIRQNNVKWNQLFVSFFTVLRVENWTVIFCCHSEDKNYFAVSMAETLLNHLRYDM
jgi:hypothetical protein